MKTAKSIEVFFKEYLRYLGSTSKTKAPSLNIISQAPGALKCIHSISDIASQTTALEFNPLGQRPAVVDIQFNIPGVVHEFQKISDTAQSIFLLLHETMHVILWEPFFAGKFKIRSKREFLDLCRCFEAFSFWYCDIYMAPRLRSKTPDGEFIFSRSTPSHMYLNPYRALERSKMPLEESLEVYLKSFQGLETKIYNNKDLYLRNLADRLYSFYYGSTQDIERYYSTLKKNGYFDYFSKIAYDIEGLPVLFSTQIDPTVSSLHCRQYCLDFFKTKLRHIEKISPDEIFKIKVRRHIQVRIYYASLVQAQIKQKNVFSQKRISSNSMRTILTNIGIYIDRQRSLLEKLAAGSSSIALLKLSKSLDRFYDKNIYRPLRLMDVWIRIVQYILPKTDPANDLFGLLPQDVTWNSRKMKNNFQYIQRALLAKNLKNNIGLNKSLFRDLTKIENSVSQKRLTERERTDFVRAYNRVLQSPNVLPLWSLNVCRIRPIKNEFCDINMRYE